MAFKTLIETPEAEVARLAAANEGSINHELSKLQVNIRGSLLDLMIEVPHLNGRFDHTTIIVVPFHFHADQPKDGDLPLQRHSGSWDCIVVASNDARYPVGGHRMNFSTAELVRGVQHTFDLAGIEDAQ